MLKFFRQIRQKLLENGNLRKYFWYALGEIMLVMIGILLALQVNNWNEERKNQAEEQFYLQKLSRDLTQDSVNIQNVVSALDTMIIKLEVMASEMNDPKKTTFTHDISALLASTNAVILESATWENLKSSGKISVIRNQEILEAIYQYHNSHVNSVSVWSESVKDYSRNVIMPELMKFDKIPFGFQDYVLAQFGFKVFEKSAHEYGANTFIQNAVVYKSLTSQVLKSMFEAKLEEITTLKMLISIELTN